MNIRDYLKTHFAKSDRTVLEDHINDLIHQFEIFIKTYPNVLTDKEKQLLKLSIEYHDYGKLNKLFQDKLKGKVKSDEIPHQFLSPLFS